MSYLLSNQLSLANYIEDEMTEESITNLASTAVSSRIIHLSAVCLHDSLIIILCLGVLKCDVGSLENASDQSFVCSSVEGVLAKMLD